MPLAARFARSVLRSAARPGPTRRGLISGPPQEPLGPAESVVALVAMAVTCLGPAAWVLSHLEDYKKGE
ncbi:COX8A oxidase, partial [Syrrhaptes paradoxus]|nr:COX8A oxidase [Syrrhaptes paradoxus]